ncbi:hypothetical protein SRHO_G00016850 [Serrasalmus rhombeus]
MPKLQYQGDTGAQTAASCSAAPGPCASCSSGDCRTSSKGTTYLTRGWLIAHASQTGDCEVERKDSPFLQAVGHILPLPAEELLTQIPHIVAEEPVSELMPAWPALIQLIHLPPSVS